MPTTLLGDPDGARPRIYHKDGGSLRLLSGIMPAKILKGPTNWATLRTNAFLGVTSDFILEAGHIPPA